MGALTREQYLAWRERITENLEMALSEVPDNPVMENYAARNVHTYLQCLAMLEKMWKGDEK